MEERVVKPVISLSGKIGYWILGFLMHKIDNKYQKAKIKNLEYLLDFQKYNIKEKKKKMEKKEKKNKATRIIKKQQHQPQKDYIQRLL